MSGLISRRNVAKTALAAASGAAMVGYEARATGVITTSKTKLDQVVSINDEFGPNDAGLNDATGAINEVAAWLAQRGGGKIVADPGVYKITGSVLLASNLNFEIPGVTLRGTGANTVFQTGFLNGDVLEENVSQWGTGFTGNGTNAVSRARVYGVKVENCAKAARLHRFNYGSKFEMCDLGGNDRSIHASHSWGQAYIDNFVRSPMQLQDFVDWTRVVGNSFEEIAGIAGLIIGQDQEGGETTYGGSWTLEVSGNGFHYCDVGIMPRIEVDNLTIRQNHFESSTRHIYQPGMLRCENWTIEANHLAATNGNVVTAIEMQHLKNSVIGKNDWVTTGGGSFAKKVILNTDSCNGNKVVVPFSTSNGKPDLSLFTMRDTNFIEQNGGSNNSGMTQPTQETWSGSGNYTVEKYRALHRKVIGAIPHCNRTSGINSITVLANHVDADTWGTSQPVMFSFDTVGANYSYRLVGMVAGLSVTMFQNQRRTTGGGVPDAGEATVNASTVGGKLQILVSGLADVTNNCSGFVKAL